MLLDTSKAAAYLGAAGHQLIYWRRQGYGPAYVRRGRAICYRREALDAWREWCEAYRVKYGAVTYGKAAQWAHKLKRRPGGEHQVLEADPRPPMLDGTTVD